MSYQALRDANTARQQDSSYNCQDWTFDDWLLATMGEWGELQNYLKKVRRGDFPLADAIGAIGEEMADVVIYLEGLTIHIQPDFVLQPDTEYYEHYMRCSPDTIAGQCSLLTAAFGDLLYSKESPQLNLRLIVGMLEDLATELGLNLHAEVRDKFNEVSSRVGSYVRMI